MSTEKRRGKREAPKAQATEPVQPPPRMALPTPARTSYTRAGVWAQLRHQTRYEIMSVVRSAAFVIILLRLVFSSRTKYDEAARLPLDDGKER